jgi:hypothetical protein
VSGTEFGMVPGAVGPAGGVLAGSFPNPSFASPPLQRQAGTVAAGFALQNATPNILTWTAPNDGQIHRFFLIGALEVTSAQTGGGVGVTFTLPDGSAASPTWVAGNNAAGITFPNFRSGLVQAGTTVTLLQSSAQTLGAAVVHAEIWAA